MPDEAIRNIWGVGEQLVLCRDRRAGLQAVIAIDDTTLGAGLGGVRCAAYPNERAAIVEAQRLAAGMTLKHASAELPYGGAKAVILAPSENADRGSLMHRFGEFVARTGGAYIPGVDMGTTTADLRAIGGAGVTVSCDDEDPSPWTALGVAAAIRAAVAHVDARGRLDHMTVLVQGAGHVGAALARHLADDGARLLIADIDDERAAAVAAAVGGRVIAADAAITTKCDVLAPCAAARVVSATTVPSLRCRMIVGAANDTLADTRDAQRLAASGIVYVPDFIANAGGVIQIHARFSGHDDERLRADVLRIGDRVTELLERADRAGATPLEAATVRVRRTLERARLERPPRNAPVVEAAVA